MKKRCGKTLLGIISFVFAVTPAWAAPAQPNAGDVLNSLEGRLNNKPAAQAEVPLEQTNKETSNVQQDGERIVVTKFQVTGQDVYPAEQLERLMAAGVGQELSLQQMQKLAQNITAYLRSQGYLAAGAYIPAQSIVDGQVQVVAVIGKYDRITIDNQSQLKEETIQGYVGELHPGSYITGKQLERVLLLLNDLGGVTAKAVLEPGDAAGSSHVTVVVADGSPVNGRIVIDNYGSSYTGRTRYILDGSANNLSGQGDRLEVGGILTADDTNDYRLGYSRWLGHDGLRIGVSHSHMNYTLNGAFSSLDASGNADTDNVFFNYPLIRSRQQNLFLYGGYAKRKLADDVNLIGNNNRRSNKIWNMGVNGNKAQLSYDLNVSRGKLSLDSADAVSADSLAQTAGGYTKVNVSTYYRQWLSRQCEVRVTGFEQWADKNLDSSEKFNLGGPYGVRAYSSDAVSGDEGYLLSGEVRYHLPDSKLQAIAFIDSGAVDINKNTWSGAGANRQTLSGWGLGLLWENNDRASVRMDYSWKLNHNQDVEDGGNGHFWIRGEYKL